MSNLIEESEAEVSVNDLSDKVLTESELLFTLGMKKSLLSSLRRDGKIAFCPLSRSCRVYFAKDVLAFLEKKRVVLNSG